jgi:hypothetical protein
MIADVLKISQPCRFVFRWLSAGFCFGSGECSYAPQLVSRRVAKMLFVKTIED